MVDAGGGKGSIISSCFERGARLVHPDIKVDPGAGYLVGNNSTAAAQVIIMYGLLAVRYVALNIYYLNNTTHIVIFGF